MGLANPLDKLNSTLGGSKPSSPPSPPVQAAKTFGAKVVDKVKSAVGGNKPPPPKPQPVKGYKKGGIVTRGKKGC